MFSSCHNVSDNGQLLLVQWPDGKPYLEQDNVVIEMFSLIRDVYMKHLKRQSEKLKRKAKSRR